MTTGRINQVAVRRASASGPLPRETDGTETHHRLRRPSSVAESGRLRRVARRRNDVATLADTGLRRDLAPNSPTATAISIDLPTADAPRCDGAVSAPRRNASAGRLGLRRRTGGTAIFHSRSDDPLRDPNPQDCRVLNVATPTGDFHISGREDRLLAETDHDTPRPAGRLGEDRWSTVA